VVKSSLLRLVAAGDVIQPDPRARLPGRGAYVHPSLACLDLARGAGRSPGPCAPRDRSASNHWLSTFAANNPRK
jgi:Predicted nucleic-acid-binding protein implicated in transcription termination